MAGVALEARINDKPRGQPPMDGTEVTHRIPDLGGRRRDNELFANGCHRTLLASVSLVDARHAWRKLLPRTAVDAVGFHQVRHERREPRVQSAARTRRTTRDTRAAEDRYRSRRRARGR